MKVDATIREIDIETVRKDFPVLSVKMGDNSIAYLDSGATAQKPLAVIERMKEFDSHQYATVHRGSYRLGEEATQIFESGRETIASFIGAKQGREIVYTSGATMSINLVAYGYGRKFIRRGDEIVISDMEHHANIVPWLKLCEETGAVLKVIPVTETGEFDESAFVKLLSARTKLVSITHVSNVLGTVNRVKELSALAHSAGAKVLVDGAQAAPHMKIDVSEIDSDFYVFSGHKMYGPTGVGVLYGKYDLLETMDPLLTGGDMIERVTFAGATYAPPPQRFEAGTPPITQVVGLCAAIDYLSAIGMETIEERERELLEYGSDLLRKIPQVRIIGTAPGKAAILSFVVDSVHPHDMVTILDGEGVAVRGGHHCAQPLMDRYNIPAATRASLAFYNTTEELDRLSAAIRKAVALFG